MKCYKREWFRKRHNLKRTKNDANEIITHDNYAEIVLYDKKGNEKNRTLIDLEDIEKVKKYKWYSDNLNYVVSKCKATEGKGIYLHRLITNAKEKEVVDHINHNTLDNRKINLRKCSQHENTYNQIARKSKTGIKGITFRCNKYEARIMINYKSIYLGRFDTIEEAINARQEAELKYFKEYRNQD